MDIVVYNFGDYSRGPSTANIFNCHICKARHSSYPEVEGHYLTRHENVIVVLQEGDKLSINRHFVGPRGERPKYLIEKLPKSKSKPFLEIGPLLFPDLQLDPMEMELDTAASPYPCQSVSGSEPVEEVQLEQNNSPMSFKESTWNAGLDNLDISSVLSDCGEELVLLSPVLETSPASFDISNQMSSIYHYTIDHGQCHTAVSPETNSSSFGGPDAKEMPGFNLDDINLDEVLEFALCLEQEMLNNKSGMLNLFNTGH